MRRGGPYLIPKGGKLRLILNSYFSESPAAAATLTISFALSLLSGRALHCGYSRYLQAGSRSAS